jgi:asparagine synthase (glutamine-hydrolysing)
VMSPATSLPYENFASLHLPEPSHEPFFNANALQYQRVAVHTRVALSGYGGDDILIGQAWPHLLYLFRRAKFATLLGAFGGYILRHRRIPPPRAGFRARLVRWMGRVHPTEEFPPWLAPSFVQCHHLRDRWELLQQSEDSPHPVHPAGYAGLCSNFWAATFEQEDSAFTGLPLELRAPFLDQRILRFLLRLPPVPWCMDKELLRLATHDLLPEAVRTRPKAGIPEDPLRVFARSGRWTPALEDPTKCLREFVDCPRLSATLQTSSDLWIDLRPVSLDYWLKTIENQGRIR